jgi:hypothetical protein
MNGQDVLCFPLEATNAILYGKKKDVFPVVDQSTKWTEDFCISESIFGSPIIGPLLEIIAMACLDPLVILKHGIKTGKLPASGCIMVAPGGKDSPMSAMGTLVFYFLATSASGDVERARLLENAINYLARPNGWRMADTDFAQLKRQIDIVLLDESMTREIASFNEKLREIIEREMANRKLEIGQGIRQGISVSLLPPPSSIN